MSEYKFTLRFRLPDINDDPEEYLDALFEAGCDDAVIGTGQAGYIAMEFLRESDSVENAIYSAIAAVKNAIDNATLLEASPDIVGLTDAANLLHVSRQYMRQLKESNAELFPMPLHTGKSALYYLTDILEFVGTVTNRQLEPTIFEVASVNRALNAYRNAVTIKTYTYVTKAAMKVRAKGMRKTRKGMRTAGKIQTKVGEVQTIGAITAPTTEQNENDKANTTFWANLGIPEDVQALIKDNHHHS